MKELSYKVTFTTPAFLGNADQKAQWRTPPFKALVRHWWRIVKAKEFGYDHSKLLAAENALFGTAGESGKSHRSLVQFRLAEWRDGQLSNSNWPRSEMRDIAVGTAKLPCDVYLGFGAITPASKKQGIGKPQLKNTALEPDQSNVLVIRFAPAVSPAQVADVAKAIALASDFGTLGNRSRNGWGSVNFTSLAAPEGVSVEGYRSAVTASLAKCLAHDWASAIGTDDKGPLIWQGRTVSNWREAVFELAKLRQRLRKAAKAGGSGRDIKSSQVVAYPVTQGNNSAWDSRARIANSLRLKVVPGSDKGSLIPVAVHMPAAVPAELVNKLSTQDQNWLNQHELGIWQLVHAELDAAMSRKEWK